MRTFTLYKNNRLDGAYEASSDELAERFMRSEYASMPMNFERLVGMWLANDEQATCDRDVQFAIIDAIDEHRQARPLENQTEES